MDHAQLSVSSVRLSSIVTLLTDLKPFQLAPMEWVRLKVSSRPETATGVLATKRITLPPVEFWMQVGRLEAADPIQL